jgi:effector-binding domain-containing protein
MLPRSGTKIRDERTGALSEFRLVEMEEQPTAVVRARVPQAEVSDFFAEGLGSVREALEARGLAPSGPPFARFRDVQDGADLDLEVGFPVAAPFSPDGADQAVEAGVLEGGPAGRVEHVGSYDELPAVRVELEEWLRGQGRHPVGEMWQHYLSAPDHGAPPWRTLLVVPVQPA